MAESQNKDKIKVLSPNLFPVVGVGASAGGLEAFKRLIKSIPENSGMAYILVQHLEPTHESILAELLQKVTRIPIYEITNNLRVEPGRIYIIPSNKLLTATDGILQLSPRLPRSEKNMPIDVFFTSLAEVHQSHAIGVVLSGTATDGTLGLKAIKDHGGITFAQEQNSAGFEGMPQSAIDADVVDFILTPEEIPLKIADLNNAFNAGLPHDNGDLPLNQEETYRQLLSLLRVRRGADFTHYKQTTIRRRVLRRMGMNKTSNIAEYLSYVKDNPAELDILYQDLLIPVTAFFRDPKTFETFCEVLFPLLLKGKGEENPLRIWIAGCSTGEEPYSIAICLQEYLGDHASDCKIQLFATDISEKSISKARRGIYTKRDVATLSPGRLQKYFTKVHGGFQINKVIRDMCVFASHNFLKDPPFAKMDLISCRNVLIYMEPVLQKKALALFHYALKENGYLLLGKSETATPVVDLFTIFDKPDKIYQRKTVPSKLLHVVSKNEIWGKDRKDPAILEPVREDFHKSTDAVLLAQFTPPGVVVNEQMDIVQVRGSVGKWLEPSPGKPTMNLMKMAREGLSFELRNAIHKAKSGNKPVSKENVLMRFMGRQQFTTIHVIPLPDTTEPYYLILFSDQRPSSGMAAGSSQEANGGSSEMAPSPEESIIQRMENELILLREDMRSITEEQESVNEELQSANEELLSGSEELQSLNEELETSKEEIQSTNEELSSLNGELFDRNEQLNLSRIYAESIVATIREPLIVLDIDLRVKTANRSYYEKFRTSETETEGKLFYEIGNGQWDIPALRSSLTTILSDEKKISGFEIKKTFDLLGERIMLLNVTRIYRKEKAEQLILLAIEDVTEAKKREGELKLFTGELEKKVEERTISLKEANALLKHSNENLQQFASIASHDLQEPLRKIRTFANLLNIRYSHDIGGEAEVLLKKISLATERMAVLITDVLNFSKIPDYAGRFEKTDLNEILKNVITDFDLLIAEKKASVTHDQLPVIYAIPWQINQLFYNLLGNALKFSKVDPEPVIDIRMRMLPLEEFHQYPALNKKSSYCELTFQDNGIGFDQKFSEEIFLIFHRLNPRELFEGTGIGLALCKKIVINHHGEILARIKENAGTQFLVILPMEQ